MRNQIGEEQARQGMLELIKVKILIVGSEDAPSAIRMEMSSEVDLFFHFMHFIDEKSFARVQEAQKLMVDLSDYPTILVRMLNSCIKEPHISLGIFTLLNDAEARLDFIQNMEYKFVELMYCACIRSPEEVVQHHITYRYNAMKQKMSIMQARLQEINNLVKIKNPSLLLQLQKSSITSASTSSMTINNNTGGGGRSSHNSSFSSLIGNSGGRSGGSVSGQREFR